MVHWSFLCVDSYHYRLTHSHMHHAERHMRNERHYIFDPKIIL